ncbi:Methyltransferase-like protein 5 [Lobulomyces angularis]|nr:Methyltransferase-like protein 5 [Lobulomyces angularis]
MKLKQLESLLQEVSTFKNPKAYLDLKFTDLIKIFNEEQYPTSPHIAARLLYTAENQFGDISDSIICDLGVGCGVLSIASWIMGASYVFGLDIDDDAIAQASENFLEFDINQDLVKFDIASFINSKNLVEPRFVADTVIMNPPFGTKIKGVDICFLEFAAKVAKKSIYSLHKSSTREFIIKKALSLGLHTEVLAEIKYDINNMYKFHKKKSVNVEVDFLRFSFI